MTTKLFVCIAIVGAVACQQKQFMVPRNSLDRYFQQTTLPAAIMGYATKHGKASWYAFGPAIWGASNTVTEDHIFRISSMTKAISSVAVLQLVEEGLIGLDEPLNQLMPEMTSIPVLTADGQRSGLSKTLTAG